MARSRRSDVVFARSYLSPTLVLLAFDWPAATGRDDFLGFAIERTPGLRGQASSWLPNRISFPGLASSAKEFPSNTSPIQKFMWWDARIDDSDRERRFSYRIIPVVGTPRCLQLVEDAEKALTVKLPPPVVDSIGTYFNRAVVSSQAFVEKFGHDVKPSKLGQALAWLANGLQDVVPAFIEGNVDIDGAIYHLTDAQWIIPAFKKRTAPTNLVYNKTKRDNTNATAVAELANVTFAPRTKANIMHDKLLVKARGGNAVAVLTGSANFTTEGLTMQANLLHTFDSPSLADLYLKRKQILEADPSMAQIAKKAGWSGPVMVGKGKTRVRVFFSPEPGGSRASLDAIVDAVEGARSSVIFCLFKPTDEALRHACFAAGDRGLMMYGLVNSISKPKSNAKRNRASEAQVELYDREHKKRDLVSHSRYVRGTEPAGFWWEDAKLPGEAARWPVYIHHKFVVVDAETSKPTIFTGSANMSGNSLYNNDENLLEINGNPDLAHIYLAEFVRLFEHYRARAAYRRRGKRRSYGLAKDSSWAKKAYTPGTPEYKNRTALAGFPR
jgi:hypothetical protein